MSDPFDVIPTLGWHLDISDPHTFRVFMAKIRKLQPALSFERDQQGRVIGASRSYVLHSESIYRRLTALAGRVSAEEFRALTREMMETLPIAYTQEARLSGRPHVLNSYLHVFFRLPVMAGDPALLREVAERTALSKARETDLCLSWLRSKHASRVHEAFGAEVVRRATARMLMHYIEAGNVAQGRWSIAEQCHQRHFFVANLPWLNHPGDASDLCKRVAQYDEQLLPLMLAEAIGRELSGDQGVALIQWVFQAFLDGVVDGTVSVKRARRYANALSRVVSTTGLWGGALTNKRERHRLTRVLPKLLDFRAQLPAEQIRLDAVLLPAVSGCRAVEDESDDRCKDFSALDRQIFADIIQTFDRAFDAQAAARLVGAHPHLAAAALAFGHTPESLLAAAPDKQRAQVLDAMF